MNSPKNQGREILNGGQESALKLRQELAHEISGKYGIDTKIAERFLSTSTNISLDSLRKEVESRGDTLSETKLSELQNIITGYQNILKESSKQERDVLRLSFEKVRTDLSTGDMILKNVAPNLYYRVNHPKNIADHVTGAIAGVGVSIITLLDVCYRIGLGVITAPKDIIDIATGKGVYENWKRV